MSTGHLLERLLTSQENVTLLAHPFSASRGKQVPWLLKDNYEDGMNSEELREYEGGMLKEIGTWWQTLSKSAQTVSEIQPACNLSTRLILNRMRASSSSTPIHSSLSCPTK